MLLTVIAEAQKHQRSLFSNTNKPNDSSESNCYEIDTKIRRTETSPNVKSNNAAENIGILLEPPSVQSWIIPLFQ